MHVERETVHRLLPIASAQGVELRSHPASDEGVIHAVEAYAGVDRLSLPLGGDQLALR